MTLRGASTGFAAARWMSWDQVVVPATMIVSASTARIAAMTALWYASTSSQATLFGSFAIS